MYFAIGGRRVQSGLYRVSYAGDESIAAVDMTPELTEEAELRRRLEAFHGEHKEEALGNSWAYLDHEDRWVRWAARTAIEHQPIELWFRRAFKDQSPGRRIEGMLALARLTGVAPSQREEIEGAEVGDSKQGEVFASEAEQRDAMLKSLLEIDFDALSEEWKINYTRVVQIILVRFGEPGDEIKSALITKLDPALPAKSDELNWVLLETLVFLQDPNAAAT